MSALTDVHPFSKAQMNKAPGPDSSSNSECGASIIFHHEKSNFGQTIYIMTIIIIFYNSLWFTHNSLLIHTVSYCYEFLEHHLSKSWLAWPAARLHDWSSHRLKIMPGNLCQLKKDVLKKGNLKCDLVLYQSFCQSFSASQQYFSRWATAPICQTYQTYPDAESRRHLKAPQKNVKWQEHSQVQFQLFHPFEATFRGWSYRCVQLARTNRELSVFIDH